MQAGTRDVYIQIKEIKTRKFLFETLQDSTSCSLLLLSIPINKSDHSCLSIRARVVRLLHHGPPLPFPPHHKRERRPAAMLVVWAQRRGRPDVSLCVHRQNRHRQPEDDRRGGTRARGINERGRDRKRWCVRVVGTGSVRTCRA